MLRPSHASYLDQPNNIWWAVRIIKRFIILLSLLPSFIFPLRPKLISQHSLLEHLQTMFFPQCE
jgi:hypothetical protein